MLLAGAGDLIDLVAGARDARYWVVGSVVGWCARQCERKGERLGFGLLAVARDRGDGKLVVWRRIMTELSAGARDRARDEKGLLVGLLAGNRER